MADLDTLRPTFSSLSYEEKLALILRRRQNRREKRAATAARYRTKAKKSVSARKPKKVRLADAIDNLSPEQAKLLLAQLQKQNGNL